MDIMDSVDNGIHQALFWYIVKGLDPGSFVIALLRGDSPDAHRRAHVLIVEQIPALLDFVSDSVPTFARGEYVETWIAHDGMEGAPESQKIMFRMSVEDLHFANMFGNKITRDFIEKHYPPVK